MPLNRAWTPMLLLTGLILATAHYQVTVHASELDPRVSMACSFLKTLYDPSLQLVRETLSKRVYNIASDNRPEPKSSWTNQTLAMSKNCLTVCLRKPAGHDGDLCHYSVVDDAVAS